MQIFLMILAIYTLSFILRNLSGPFNILGIIRNKLMSNRFFGVFFYELFTCPWCIGFHCGYIVYLLGTRYSTTSEIFIWSLAGSAIAAFGDKFYEKNMLN